MNDTAMHLETLDAGKRRTIATQAKAIGPGYYLAGGTALALRPGHRTSRDLDWFTAEAVDVARLQKALAAAVPAPTKQGAMGANAIRFYYGGLETSFITYRAMLPSIEVVDVDGVAIPVATIEHIAAMKAAALLGRTEKRDYVDTFAICSLPDWPVRRFLDNAKHHLGIAPDMLIRAMVYFADVEATEMPKRSRYTWEQVKTGLTRLVAVK